MGRARPQGRSEYNMNWTTTRRRLADIWPRIEHLSPERQPGTPGRPADYADRIVFEAILYMVWTNSSMRTRLRKSYPSPCPLYRRISNWVATRTLDELWGAYLEHLGHEELEAWFGVFCGIRNAENKRRGISTGLAWYIVMERGIEDALDKADRSLKKKRAARGR